MRLSGKVAIITGAAGTLGSTSARRFAEEGAKLVLVDRDEDRLAEIASALDPDRTLELFADVARAEDMARVAEESLRRFGAIHFFWANAGIEGMAAQDMQDYPDELFDKVIEVNLRGVYIGIKIILPKMEEGGSVLITSSIAGLKGMPLNVPYVASKHAVVGIRRSCAIIAGPRRIRVNTIHPGFVDSDMMDRLIEQHSDPEASVQNLAEQAMLDRFTQPEDIANGALFLASDESRAITNQGLVVDCGIVQ